MTFRQEFLQPSDVRCCRDDGNSEAGNSEAEAVGTIEAVRMGQHENKEPSLCVIQTQFPQSKPRWLIEPI